MLGFLFSFVFLVFILLVFFLYESPLNLLMGKGKDRQSQGKIVQSMDCIFLCFVYHMVKGCRCNSEISALPMFTVSYQSVSGR